MLSVILCPTLNLTDHLEANVDSETVGSRMTFKCDDGYKLDGGNDTHVCGPHGQWMGDMPTCSRNLCLLCSIVQSFVLPI